MINTKNLNPKERAEKVAKLRQEHEDYFQTIGKINALYIPKMAYRPKGKDELYVSFFESELKGECDIYTEFVSKQYDSEDPKRTLYLIPYNPFWKDEYEIITSNSGYERHFIPVSEIKPLNDITTRNKQNIINTNPITPKKPDPLEGLKEGTLHETPSVKKTETINLDIKNLVKVIEEINYTLQTLNHIIRNK